MLSARGAREPPGKRLALGSAADLPQAARAALSARPPRAVPRAARAARCGAAGSLQAPGGSRSTAEVQGSGGGRQEKTGGEDLGSDAGRARVLEAFGRESAGCPPESAPRRGARQAGGRFKGGFKITGAQTRLRSAHRRGDAQQARGRGSGQADLGTRHRAPDPRPAAVTHAWRVRDKPPRTAIAIPARPASEDPARHAASGRAQAARTPRRRVPKHQPEPPRSGPTPSCYARPRVP